MAEGVPASPLGGAGSRGLHSGIIQWLVDNFCICEGYSVPRCLMYEIYMETCGQNAQNQVNPAMFGKLVHLVFPDLGTRRLGTRGSARYHYDGICIKRSSFFYAQYCYLLGGKRCTSGDIVAFEKSTNYNCILQEEGAGDNHSPIKTEPIGSPLSGFRRCPFWEQELAKKYSYHMVAFLADEYCNCCQDILQRVRNQELERVEDLLMSFWKSLQQDTVMLLSLPDVCRLLKCYDVQLYKGIEDVLLHDFLEDVSIQYLKSVRLFSKKFKLWLLSALEGFPALLQISKLKGEHAKMWKLEELRVPGQNGHLYRAHEAEVTVFVKRLRRKTYLSNMAKTMRMVLRNSRRVSVLKSDLGTIFHQGVLDSSQKVLPRDLSGADVLGENTEMKCLSSLISLLGTSTDLSVFMNCLSSNLQEFVFQPSRSKEEFLQLAASFQLRWNFLLTAVSKAMTLCHRDSFGSWHLFHLLLAEYVIHILQSCIEEEEEEDNVGSLKEILPDDQSPVQPDHEPHHPPDCPPAQEHESLSADPPRVMLRCKGQSPGATAGSSVVVRVPGFLVDTVTGNKLIQVLLEDKATESTIKLTLPLGQETLITLTDGQKFVIHISDVSQSSEDVYLTESNADTGDYLLD
ncbi:DNA-binding protein RFX8 isoform X1 [Bos javanicus]|uniref:DNA-binding protein RFX8 isoform X1 n=2 Tax=Bos javanicus TaxID=9906 RepID=UPI002AA7288F|nr:DNA-binding protein RFX8 isoform X1 [Bos javanicus]